jgi:hypothetical protein
MRRKLSDTAGVKGMFRIHITEDKNGDELIVGDSGWKKNTVTNQGFNSFLCAAIGAAAGSSQIAAVALGSGTAPAVTDTLLPGEAVTTKRAAATYGSVGSKTAQFTATFASSNSFLTASQNLSNIGLFCTTTSTTGTIFAGNTYASSAVATNQNVNVTYNIGFA